MFVNVTALTGSGVVICVSGSGGRLQRKGCVISFIITGFISWAR